MRSLTLAVALGLACAGASRSGEIRSGADIEKELAARQAMLEERCRAFKQAVLWLTTRLEGSSKEEDRARAARLRKAVELTVKPDVRNLLQALQACKGLSVPEVVDAMHRQKMRPDDIKAIRSLLLESEYDQVHGKIVSLRQLLEALDRVIRNQMLARARTAGERASRAELGQYQTEVTSSTRQLVERIRGKKAAATNDAYAASLPSAKEFAAGLERARLSQADALDKIQHGELLAATELQDQAIQRLREARDQAHEVLRQLRQDEAERVRMMLETRSEMMLQIQLAVYVKTQESRKRIDKSSDKKLTSTGEKEAIEQAQLELQVALEARQAVHLLETEGSSVALPELFRELAEDAKRVSRRLSNGDVGTHSQAIQADIIATLRELIPVSKKAEDKIANPSRPPHQERLPAQVVEQLDELRLVRAAQARIARRVASYAGRGLHDPVIQDEIRDLAARQKWIFGFITPLPKEKNQ